MKNDSGIKSLITFFLCLIITSCNYENIKQISTSGELTVGIDETISKVALKEIDEFMRMNKEAKINAKIKTTNEVIADLINGDIKTILVNRDFTPQETEIINQHKIDIKKNKFALDGLGIIVNPANPIRKLNYTELRKIFIGNIAEWKDLEGDNSKIYDGKIKVFISRGNSATNLFFKEKVLNGTDYSKTDFVCSTSTQMLQEIRKDEKAIGMITMSWLAIAADTLDMTVKALKISELDSSGHMGDYIGFYQAYIANHSYPLVMDAYIMSTDYSMNLSVGFTTFLLSYNGQKIVLNSGLVPVTQPVKIIQLN